MNLLRWFRPGQQSPSVAEYNDSNEKRYALLVTNVDSSGATGTEVNVPDGQDVALGTTTDAAVATDADGTANAHLRGLIVLLLARLPLIGQHVKAASTSVTIASDQDAIPIIGNAGEAHLGEIGGYKRSSSVEFTRPADSTAYAALDVIGVNLAITGATNASPIVITSATHSLADGDPVTIAGVVGNTNANGDYFAKLTGYSPTTFALYTDAALTAARAGNSAYTSGGTVARLFKFLNMARIAAQNGYVVKANLMTDQKTCVARLKIHLFSQPVTAILDNSPYLRLWVNRTKRSGEILFPAMTTEDPSNSTAAGALITPNAASSNLPLGFGTAAADTAMYGMIETLDAFTPASGQSFYIRLMVEDD